MRLGRWLIWICLPAPAAPAAVSFSREVMPILALHCSSCHGDAGGLSTRSYAEVMRGGNLGKVIVPGDPDASLLIHFVEGRRGEAHRMPLGGQPLTPSQVQTIRKWAAEGARDDTARETSVRLTRRVRFGGTLRIRLQVPSPAYLTLTVSNSVTGETLFSDSGSVKSPQDPSDMGEPGKPIEWPVNAPKHWPRDVMVELQIQFGREAERAELIVTSDPSGR